MSEYYQNTNVELSSIVPEKKKSHYKANGKTSRPIGSGTRGKNGFSLPDGMSLSTGCRVYPDCLTCPLPRCIYDEALVTQVFKARLGRIFHLHDRGYTNRAIAREIGCSMYTLKDIIRGQRSELDKEYTENEFLLGLKS